MKNIGFCSLGLGKSGEEKKSRILPAELDRALKSKEKFAADFKERLLNRLEKLQNEE